MGTRVRALADWLFEPHASRVGVAIAVVSTAAIALSLGAVIGCLLMKGATDGAR